jgi:2-methylcitrate synthase
LLIYGQLPNKEELNYFSNIIISSREIPMRLKAILEIIPSSAHPMDIMRTVASALGTICPEKKGDDPKAISARLIGLFGPCLLYWFHFSKSNIKIDTQTGDDSVALNFLKLLFYDGKKVS